MNRFIIADATKCIGCRTCEVACAVSHQENQDCAALSPDEFISRICNFAFFSGLIGAQFWAERVQPKSPELDAKLLVSC